MTVIPDAGRAALDRVAGTLVGLAVGDALGAPYEFHTPGPTDPQMIGGGLGWEPGEWTDDTQMAICIAEPAASGELDLGRVAEQFLTWFRSRPKDVGIQTRAILGAAAEGADMAQAAKDYFVRTGRAAGNGSLMRTAPVALAHIADPEARWDAAVHISLLTHGDPLAGEACGLWCHGIAQAIVTASRPDLRDGLRFLPGDGADYWRGIIDEAEREQPTRFTGNGFVVRALQAAWSAIHHAPVSREVPCRHFGDALRLAISVGDDTDTVGAIAGSMLGAMWGVTAIPLAWIEPLHGWPGYRARDLVRLAVLAAAKGRSRQAGVAASRLAAPLLP